MLLVDVGCKIDRHNKTAIGMKRVAVGGSELTKSRGLPCNTCVLLQLYSTVSDVLACICIRDEHRLPSVLTLLGEAVRYSL